MTAIDINVGDVAGSLSRHLPVYAWIRPDYQTAMLRSLADLWQPDDCQVLDVGGGTGAIAQVIAELFPVDRVVSIDVKDRFASSLSIQTLIYDGTAIPFEDNSFDAVVFNNVLHHVPLDVRLPLLRECGRVAKGNIYIKDHLAKSSGDHLRLAALDWIGNIPFGGMLWAQYSTEDDWRDLARQAGFEIEARQSGLYRRGLWSVAWPNRLEISMRWRPI